MKRSELRRTTGLKPGKALARGGALSRSSRLRWHPGRTGTDPEALAALRRRSGGRCELIQAGHRCENDASEPHHRLTRKRAGRRIDALWNLLHLCWSCHQWVHSHPIQAEHEGWLLPSTS